MTGVSLEGSTRMDRRGYIAGILSVTTSSMAGCGRFRNADQREEKASDGAIESSDRSGDLPDELQEAEREIGTVFTQLSNLPIFENNDFVFDVNYFEDEFDHREVKRTAERAIERLEEITTETVSENRIELLINSAEIGRLLVAQRVMTHQIIAAGMTLERLIASGNYERGLEVAQDATLFLKNLRESGEKIEIRLSEDQRLDASIDYYDPTAINTSQENLLEVVHWSNHVYEAFQLTILGLKKYDEANAAIESAQYDVAESSYGESEQQFQAAVRSFNEAQGTGRQVPHLAHLVEGLRCLIPAYLASSGPLQSAMEEFNAGNEKRAREIAREAISSANEKATRCL